MPPAPYRECLGFTRDRVEVKHRNRSGTASTAVITELIGIANSPLPLFDLGWDKNDGAGTYDEHVQVRLDDFWPAFNQRSPFRLSLQNMSFHELLQSSEHQRMLSVLRFTASGGLALPAYCKRPLPQLFYKRYESTAKETKQENGCGEHTSTGPMELHHRE